MHVPRWHKTKISMTAEGGEPFHSLDTRSWNTFCAAEAEGCIFHRNEEIKMAVHEWL
jgi:hypothetical protein